MRFAAVAFTALISISCGAEPGSTAEGNPAAADERAGKSANDTSTGHPAPGIEAYQARFGRDRPVVAVVGPNDGAEVTDFVVPHGILARSGVAEVIAVSTESGPMELFPALTIQPDATLAEFDRAYPDGADYVIVPAVHDPDAAALNGWIRAQAAMGATVVGVCDGALVLASSGVLDGRRATAHWYSLDDLERKHSGTDWVRDRRYVADGNVVTTTGVSASVPVSLALVEAIAGRARAEEVAESLGVEGWTAAHDSDAYGITPGHFFTWAGGFVAFWRNETLGIEVEPGADEVSLALLADAWSRTSRSRVVTVGPEGPIRTRGGLMLLPDRSDRSDRPDRMLPPLSRFEVGSTLDQALQGITDRYGRRTAAFVALQLEYPWARAL